VTDEGHVRQVQVLNELGQVVGQQVHIPAPGMTIGPAMTAPVVGHTSQALIEQACDNVVPLI
jgi:hypothetical protein